LDLSKVEAGRLQIEKIEVALPELLADIRMVMQHLADEKGLRFSMTTDDLLPGTIVSDPIRLKQILTNIIANAIKFTNEGSVHVKTRVDRTQRKLHFTVTDTGSGMTPEQAARIFQPFTQADATTTRKFGGTGLGLDLARRLAQALGGDVVMVATQSDVGTVFEIAVDLEAPVYSTISRADQKPKNDTEIRLNGLHILIADDGPDNQYLVSKYLTLAGAHADIANDGIEAVAMALENDYDVILMDIQMPNLDGYQATMRLRELGCKVPVVAITAHAMRSEIEKCRLAGCDAHLSKPVSRRTLVETVHRLVHEQAGSSPALNDTQDFARPQST
jgi:CheY-like chemotaxis protein